MAYYTKVLQPDETVRIVGRLHWLIYARALFLVVIALGLAIAAGFVADATQQTYLLVGAGAFLVLALLFFLAEWVRRHTTEIVVTDRRVIYKRGLIARHTVEMNISKIETVDVDQGIGGRLLNYGTVLIRGTGESMEPLRHVGAPLEIRNAITVG